MNKTALDAAFWTYCKATGLNPDSHPAVEEAMRQAIVTYLEHANKHSDDVSPQAVDKLAGEMLDKLSTQHLETVQPGEIGKHVENLSSYPVSVYGTPTQNPSIGKRVMYEDGTPSREYEDEPTKTP